MEKFADSLIQLFQLIDEIAPDFETRQSPIGKIEMPTGIETARDFKKVYDRNLKDYQKRYPGVSEKQFREYSIKRLSRRIEAIEKDIKDNDVVHWTEIYINDYLKADNRNETHTGLYNELVDNDYISGRKDVFNHVMEYKQFPPGREKIKWLTKKAEAMYFQKELNFTVKQLNDCFVPSDGKQFREGNRTSTVPEDPLPDILQNFSTQ